MRGEDQFDKLSQEQVYFSIPELASRWRCSRATIYNRLRMSGVKVLDFGVAGRKSKKLVSAAVVLHMEAKYTKVLPWITAEKRGRKYFAYYYEKNCRLRGSLGTRSRDVALRLIHRIETALAEGPKSLLWKELQILLPFRTYKNFSNYAGVKPKQLPTWEDLKAGFSVFREQRVKVGKLAQ